MGAVKKATGAAVVAVVWIACPAAPAGADPGGDPCQLAVTFLCKFMPIAPDLDGDLDLTHSSVGIDGQPLDQSPRS